MTQADRAPPRAMGDAAVVVMALAAAAGAWASVALPLLPVVAVALVGVVLRRPAVVIVGAALVASALGRAPKPGCGRRWWGSGGGPPLS